MQDLTRADFLRSVGLYFMQDRLVMVRLRKSLLNVALLDWQDRELPAERHGRRYAEITGWVAEDVKEIALKAETIRASAACAKRWFLYYPILTPGATRFIYVFRKTR